MQVILTSFITLAKIIFALAVIYLLHLYMQLNFLASYRLNATRPTYINLTFCQTFFRTMYLDKCTILIQMFFFSNQALLLISKVFIDTFAMLCNSSRLGLLRISLIRNAWSVMRADKHIMLSYYLFRGLKQAKRYFINLPNFILTAKNRFSFQLNT